MPNVFSQLRRVAPVGAILLALATGVRAASPVPPRTPRSTIAAEAGYVVVTSPTLELRAGPSTRYYPVARVPAGTILISDAARGGWVGVGYPSGVSALVMADDATVDGDEIRITRATRLRAENQRRGVAGSWRSVLEAEIAVGQTLELREVIEDTGGDVVAYRVRPPARARAFVELGSVRTATAPEIQRFTDMLAAGEGAGERAGGDLDAAGEDGSLDRAAEVFGADAQGDPDADSAARDVPSLSELTERQAGGEESSEPDDGSGGTPPGAAGEADADSVDTSLLDPMLVPAEGAEAPAAAGGDDAVAPDEPVEPTDPVEGGGSNAAERASEADDARREAEGDVLDVDRGEPPMADEPPAPQGDSEGGSEAEPDLAGDGNGAIPDQPAGADASPARVVDTAGGGVAASPVDRPMLSAEELLGAFTRLRGDTAELERSLDELIAEFERSAPGITDARQRRATDARLEWLRLRRDLRNQRLELAAARERASAMDRRTSDAISSWESRASGFEFVGRLTTSRVYDGSRLPLMYRIESVDPLRPGTLGYVRPEDAGDLALLVGQVVGVRGEPVFDAALRLAIIRTSSVEMMSERPQR